MNIRKFLFVTVATAAAFAAQAEEAEGQTFGKWRIAFGGGFNGAVRSSIGLRNQPTPAGYSVPGGMTYEDAKRRAWARRYDGDGYINLDDIGGGISTVDWRLPADKKYYTPGGHFDLRNEYQQVVGTSVDHSSNGNSDDPYPFGLSFEASRELWIHDEAFEHRWGVDFVAGVSYYFQRDVYRAHGETTRTDTVMDGSFQTLVNDEYAMYEYDHGERLPVGGMYGYNGQYNNTPALMRNHIGDPEDIGGPTRPVVSSSTYSASGDYRELEMLFMLRPWYEITDWWRVYGEVGVGVSWGKFESDFSGSGLSYSEDFSQWDCYGVAGLGTMFRYGMFDLSIDFLGRFLRDDLDVDGKYLNGSIRRSDWGFRVMVGVEF